MLQRGCQTRALHRAEAQVQTVSTAAASTQTEPRDQDTEQLFQQNHEQPDPPGLRDFLQRVEELVVTELVKNARSHAFDGFQVNWGDHSQPVSRTDQSGGGWLCAYRRNGVHDVDLWCLQVSCLHRLQHPVAQERGLHVTSVSWSCTGSVIACAYGRYVNTDDALDQGGEICTHFFNRVFAKTLCKNNSFVLLI